MIASGVSLHVSKGGKGDSNEDAKAKGLFAIGVFLVAGNIVRPQIARTHSVVSTCTAVVVTAAGRDAAHGGANEGGLLLCCGRVGV